MEEEIRQRNGKFVTAMRKKFLCHILVAFDVAHRQLDLRHHVGLVSFSKEPTAVPLDLVSQLILRCDASVASLTLPTYFLGFHRFCPVRGVPG